MSSSREQLYLPAFLVDRSDGGGAELHQIGQQDDLALVLAIPSHNATQQIGIVGLGFGTGETDELVGADVAVLRDLAFLEHLEGGVLLRLHRTRSAQYAFATEPSYCGQRPTA